MLRSNSLMGVVKSNEQGGQKGNLIEHPLPIVESRDVITPTNSQLS